MPTAPMASRRSASWTMATGFIELVWAGAYIVGLCGERSLGAFGGMGVKSVCGHIRARVGGVETHARDRAQ